MKIKSTIVIVILIVLLAIALGYIGYVEYAKINTQKQLSVYQQGAQAGYEQAIIQVMQQASTCQQVPLHYNNNTVNLIAVECLQQNQ